VRPSLDARSIDNFFSFTYPLQPRSMFRGVNQLLPAEEVVIEKGKYLPGDIGHSILRNLGVGGLHRTMRGVYVTSKSLGKAPTHV